MIIRRLSGFCARWPKQGNAEAQPRPLVRVGLGRPARTTPRSRSGCAALPSRATPKTSWSSALCMMRAKASPRIMPRHPSGTVPPQSTASPELQSRPDVRHGSGRSTKPCRGSEVVPPRRWPGRCRCRTISASCTLTATASRRTTF
jgi:hypothetical protein